MHGMQIKALVTSVPRETDLMITIQRAANLPVRAPASYAAVGNRRGRVVSGDGADGGGAGGDGSKSTISTFVEVRFRGYVRRTMSVDGEFPLFNEQVSAAVQCAGRERPLGSG